MRFLFLVKFCFIDLCSTKKKKKMKRLKKQFFISRYSCMLEGKQKHSRSCLPPVYVDAE